MKFNKSIRNAFAAQSSGATYLTKGEAVRRFEAQLPSNVTLRTEDVNAWHGDAGRQLADIVAVDDRGEETDEVVGHAAFTWYLLESGRWEIVGYLA